MEAEEEEEEEEEEEGLYLQGGGSGELSDETEVAERSTRSRMLVPDAGSSPHGSSPQPPSLPFFCQIVDSIDIEMEASSEIDMIDTLRGDR